MNGNEDHASVKIHPLVLLVIHIAVAWLLGKFVLLPIVVSPLFKNIGLGLAGFGFLLGMLSLCAFTKARTTVNPHGLVKSIVFSMAQYGYFFDKGEGDVGGVELEQGTKLSLA